MTLLVVGAFSIGKAQMRIDSVLNIYSTSYQPERLYFQLDRPVYTPGDTIWFKGYVLAGISPSNISKNLYVDFSDVNGRVLAHLVYPIVLGGGGGQFTVPDSIVGNAVHMKGYTVWMKNFDSSFFFNKDIRIVKKATKNTVKTVPVIKPTINFFPEGGNMVAGINATVAFKANDQYGVPLAVAGGIYNSKNEKVVDFKSVHDGMGTFSIFPDANETYTAKCKVGDADVVQELPKVQPSGVVLQLKGTGIKEAFQVSRTANVPAEQKQLHILATIQQKPAYLANINLEEKQTVGGAIDMTGFPASIMQVTVFDKNWVPLSERICFVPNMKDAKVEPEFGFLKLGLGKRANNELVLRMPQGNISNLSISVIDASLGKDSADNILTHFLVTGDLHGMVYHPDYYFSDSTNEVLNNLDLVMLTHGWRRYDWDKITKAQFPTIQFPADTSYITLSGKVFGATADQLRTAGDLLILAKSTSKGQDGAMQTFILPIRPDGTFNDPKTIFTDSLNVSYQFAQKKNLADRVSVRFMNNRLVSPLKIMPDSLSLEYLKVSDTTGNAFLNFLLFEEARLAALKKTTTLEDVAVKAKPKSPLQQMDEKYTSGMFSGGFGSSFDLVNDMTAASSMNILQWLQGRVAGLQISNATSPNPSLQWRGGTPQIYLNEMPVDVETITSMPVTDMAYVKTMPPPFMGGFGGGSGGAIAIYTKKGDERGPNDAANTSKGLPHQLIAGYSSMRQFYVPNYDRIDEYNDKPDLRATLYWASTILTDADHKEYHLEFFNNDITKSFRVTLEGIDADGRFIHEEKIVE
ncbi:MAG: hypothetical protein QM610_13940 [Chitinophagaceae bacterium]